MENSGIYAINIDTLEKKLVSDKENFPYSYEFTALSPDKQRIAFFYRDGRTMFSVTVHVVNISNGETEATYYFNHLRNIEFMGNDKLLAQTTYFANSDDKAYIIPLNLD